jgi:hypothetical protein
MRTWLEKFKWLKQHNYTNLAAPAGTGWTSTSEQGLQIDFSETTMKVHNEAGNIVTGWMEMHLAEFKLLTVSLNLVHLTAEERDEMQSILNENYVLQFTNRLS